jgi:hypothetical protein
MSRRPDALGGLRSQHSQELLSLLLAFALLRQHHFQFGPDLAFFILTSERNKQLLLFGELPFTLDYFPFNTSQLVVDGLGI